MRVENDQQNVFSPPYFNVDTSDFAWYYVFNLGCCTRKTFMVLAVSLLKLTLFRFLVTNIFQNIEIFRKNHTRFLLLTSKVFFSFYKTHIFEMVGV